MSYNIDSVLIVKGALSLDKPTFDGLKAEFENCLPVRCLLNYDFEYRTCGERLFFEEGEKFEFGGRNSHELVLRDILASMDGEADLVVVWEGGDSFTGLRKTLFGTVEEMEVRFVLE